MASRPLRRVAAAAAALIVLVACTDDFAVDPQGGRDVTMEPFEWPAELILGDTITLRARTTDVGTGRVVHPAGITWGSQPAGVVQLVHAAGDSAVLRVTTLGAVQISARLEDPAFEDARIAASLTAKLQSIRVSASRADTLRSLGDSLVVRARGIDANGAEVRVGGWSWSVTGSAAALGVPAGDSTIAVATGNGRGWVVATHPLCAAACRDSARVDVGQHATRLVVTPQSALLTWIDDTAHLAGSLRDARGNPIAGAVSWTSSAPATATVGATGVVRALGNGVAEVIAQAGGFADTVAVTVQQAVATVTLSLAADTLAVGDTLQLTAVARDSGGTVVPGIAPVWTSTDSLVAQVNASGRVVARARGVADVRASASGVVGTAQLLVAAWALDFGGDDYFEVASTAALVLPDSAFTLELWVRPNSAQTSAALLGIWTGVKTGSSWALHLNGLVPVASIRSAVGNTVASVTASVAITPNVWHHIAFVFQGGAGTLYVDGAVVASATGLPTPQAVPTMPLRVGADAQPAPAFLDGEIDEIRIWGSARPAAGIAAAMSARLDPMAQPTLRAYWPLAEGAGSPVSLVGGLVGLLGGLSATPAAVPAWTTVASPAP